MIKNKASKYRKCCSGQVLVESMITYFMLIILFFISMEIVRLVAVKAYLQNYVNMVTRDIAFQSGYFLKKNGFYTDDLKESIGNDIKNIFQKNFQLRNIARYSFSPSQREGVLALNAIPVSVDLRTPWGFDRTSIKPEDYGVYTAMHICIPVMFSNVYEHLKVNDVTVGHDVNSLDSRDCLGQIFSQDVRGIFWFRVRVAAYAPWPTSLEILTHGYAFPIDVAHLEQSVYEDTLGGLDAMPLVKYLSPNQQR